LSDEETEGEQKEMKVTVEDISPVQKRLSVEVPPDVVSREFDGAYRRLNRDVSVKGFRKGKTPRTVLERFYAPQVQKEVLEALIEQTLPKALEEAQVELVLQPRLDAASELKTHSVFSYSALLDLWPKFDLPRYKGIELEKPPVEVSDEEVQEQLDALRKHFATVESVEEDRPLQDGDLAVVDYRGEIDGAPVEGLEENDYYLEVGTGHFHPDFEGQLRGMERGSEKTIEISYPQNAVNAKVAGKTVRYAVLLKDIRRRVLPEVNDEFAQKFGANYKTAEDLRIRIRGQIQADKEEASENVVRRQLLKHLSDKVDFPVPERLVEEKLNQMVDNLAGHLQERGVDLERAGLSEDRLRERMREDAVTQVKTELILDKVAEAEDITIPHDEVTRYIDQQEGAEGLDKNQLRVAMARHVLPKLRAKKTVDFLLANAVIRPAAPGEAPPGQGVEE